MLRVHHGQTIAAGQPLLSGRPVQTRSEIAGTATVVDDAPVPTVRIADGADVREYTFSRFDRLAVKTGDRVKAGQSLIRVRNSVGARRSSANSPAGSTSAVRGSTCRTAATSKTSPGSNCCAAGAST